jgi:L-amino acid N-acyltransferase YncA
MTGARSEWRIRPAARADVAAITAIYNDAVRTTTGTFDTEPKSLTDRTRWLRSHDDRHPVVIAESEGAVVGWGSVSAWSDRCAYDATGEVSVYVAAPQRGRGVGRAILGALVERAAGLGYHSLLARIAEGNEASLRLHMGQRFVPVGVMREAGVKFGRRLDVHLLQRMIEPPGGAPGAGASAPTTRA